MAQPPHPHPPILVGSAERSDEAIIRAANIIESRFMNYSGFSLQGKGRLDLVVVIIIAMLLRHLQIAARRRVGRAARHLEVVGIVVVAVVVT